jgi:formyl-CoA transferase
MRLLEGIRVLDFGRYIAGPYCAALLGDLGADVIRVERVEGGEDRLVLPLTPTGEGGLYLQMNRNKRCLTLDLASDAGRQIVRQLAETADVVVANLPPGTLRHLGLDYATLSALNPRIVLTTATAYGPGGPLSHQPGFDSVGQAMSGAMFMSGLPDAPMRAHAPYVDVSTAQALAMGTLAALWARERSGRGQQVEASLLRTSLVHTNPVLIEQALSVPNRVPQGNRGYGAAPSDLFRTSSGWIVVATIGRPMFDRWCDLVGRADMKTDPRFGDDEQRGKHSADISAVMAEWCAGQDSNTVLAALSKAKIPAAPVLSPQQALDDEHVRVAGLLTQRPFADTDIHYPLAQHPVQMSADPAAFSRPAPRLGQHTEEILESLGYDAATIAEMRSRRVV